MDKANLKPVKSTLIAAYDYNPESKVLTVQFKNGKEISYKDVEPPVMSKVMDTASSVGKAFHRLIVGKYKTIQSEE